MMNANYRLRHVFGQANPNAPLKSLFVIVDDDDRIVFKTVSRNRMELELVKRKLLCVDPIVTTHQWTTELEPTP